MSLNIDSKKDSQRKKKLGAWGEEIAADALREHGFEKVENINRKESNSKFADIYAEKAGLRFIFSVKTRNKYKKGTRQLNGGYNLLYDGKDMSAREIEQKFNAKAHWIAVQVDKSAYSVYMGSLDELTAKDIRLKPCMEGRLGKCLRKDRPHDMDYSEFGNK